jgi:hypothetical protein
MPAGKDLLSIANMIAARLRETAVARERAVAAPHLEISWLHDADLQDDAEQRMTGYAPVASKPADDRPGVGATRVATIKRRLCFGLLPFVRPRHDDAVLPSVKAWPGGGGVSGSGERRPSLTAAARDVMRRHRSGRRNVCRPN